MPMWTLTKSLNNFTKIIFYDYTMQINQEMSSSSRRRSWINKTQTRICPPPLKKTWFIFLIHSWKKSKFGYTIRVIEHTFITVNFIFQDKAHSSLFFLTTFWPAFLNGFTQEGFFLYYQLSSEKSKEDFFSHISLSKNLQKVNPSKS